MIDTPQRLRRALTLLGGADELFVDTEFHREQTYWPQFALMQIAVRGAEGGRCFLIDPLAIDDLGPLWRLLLDPGRRKIFHAARQDVEIIHHASGGLPLPLFDTQVAAALLGYGQQVGFGTLVQQLTGVTLAKEATFTDWLARPLSAAQRRYAADDVLHLIPVYDHLRAQLQARGRSDWLDDEQRQLTDPRAYQPDVETLFWRTKGSKSLKPKQLAVLRPLVAWREQTAQARDLPRKRLIPDESLVELARQEELDLERLAAIRGISRGLVKRFGAELLAAWRRGIATPPEEWPRRRRAATPATPGSAPRADLLDALLQLKAAELEIAPAILASKSDLAALASWGGRKQPGPPPDIPLLRGWRRRLIGETMLEMLAGRLMIRIDPERRLPVILPVAPH
ncbi:MAG: ribonuclease D [Zetaproteobacteria bacterium]|nr:MAG: ribonuclease D [Zetaproteobacteria bacterium]